MKRGIALLCAALLLTTGARAVEVSAPSAILMEKETGTVLFAKDEHKQLEPASVTKVMTLLLTMEAVDSGQMKYDDMVTASAHACSFQLGCRRSNSTRGVLLSRHAVKLAATPSGLKGRRYWYITS